MKFMPLALAATLLLPSCATTRIAPPAKAGTVDHVVMLWQKRPGNAADTKALRDAATHLREIPGIVFIDHGTPLASSRDVVDDSFDVGYVMRFDSAASLQAYDTHPDHVEQVEKVIRPLTRKVVVYDIIR